MRFDGTFTDGWMRRFAASASATEAELTALDQQAGDGDFGVNLTTGLDATVRALNGAPTGSLAAAQQPLQTAATTFLDEVGGTSGPLFGLLLEELALAAAAGTALTVPALAAGAGSGLSVIQRIGEAAPGDKTLIDALAPACDALNSRGTDADVRKALAAAAGAAWDGVRNTAQLRARRGRASYLGERATGVADPGAVGIGLLFASAGETVTALAPFLTCLSASLPGTETRPRP
ncbi:dihydroxyacetone kinase subunit L [Streptomyces kasugaensis]|uniref:Dihydroxyacetone kinase subunit L n=1 Tax=Streptomyces kasugaensis TaxID=1946 RepID=A0A4Q9HZT5_STRKA|nr:dihydroxyacetone kinase subunit DhaL [Streptomyces kasugaensis]TBO60853.1 dihydroxyacetone kinase subunit L [Streptomyces kasugaensis]